MNRLAIDDFLATILASWSEAAAEWQPPGQGSAHLCTTCSSSLVARVLDLSAWPHDLMHHLASTLDAAAVDIQDTLQDRSIPGYGSGAGAVARYVTDTVRKQRDDLGEILTHCVEPRIEAFVSRAVDAILPRVAL
ncbi:hypothetical protein M2152_000070 [Microbacteriaceae bacterium SG_E_30_P1]|uniref:Uncharacterized protein n=1 Tax=Antiquaquibacter oligotrophicus TaxID=2880260 RepID=A0ABT6KKD0_9MICO|nr:hypothetical protein [Antiquaquibacter oligotrophicus]MDH6179888.1 hypothetical protein [Antiquaquibacter oligotrophicus]UDF14351.1 hypothetical protein LH407_05680 [Antiquaquibacter oligotrophicus]